MSNILFYFEVIKYCFLALFTGSIFFKWAEDSGVVKFRRFYYYFGIVSYRKQIQNISLEQVERLDNVGLTTDNFVVFVSGNTIFFHSKTFGESFEASEMPNLAFELRGRAEFGENSLKITTLESIHEIGGMIGFIGILVAGGNFQLFAIVGGILMSLFLVAIHFVVLHEDKTSFELAIRELEELFRD